MSNLNKTSGTEKVSSYYRYLLAAAGFLTTLSLGTLYAWAIFKPHLVAEFGWTSAMVTIPFTVASVVFALGMVPAGRLQDLKGPRPLLMISAVLALAGYGLSSLTEHLWWLIITYGIIMGTAIAMGYSAVVAGGLKWFPDRRGTATGILVGGFGAAAAVFGPLAHYMIGEFGWRTTFVYLGIIFSILIGLCALVIKNPPPGWKPAGWDPTSASGIRKRSPEYTGFEFTIKQMLKTRQFWLMWTHYVLILCGGFAIVVHLKQLAQGVGFSPDAAVGLVALIGLLNVSGRFVISPMSDIIGRLKSFTIIGSLMMLATLSASLAVLLEAPGLLYFTAIAGGSAFGGYLALSPAFTADMWGMKSVGVNYGAMFVGWGLASFIGPFFAGRLYDYTGSYVPIFFIFSGMCLLAVLLAKLFVRPSDLKAHAIKMGIEKAGG